MTRGKTKAHAEREQQMALKRWRSIRPSVVFRKDGQPFSDDDVNVLMLKLGKAAEGLGFVLGGCEFSELPPARFEESHQ